MAKIRSATTRQAAAGSQSRPPPPRKASKAPSPRRAPRQQLESTVARARAGTYPESIAERVSAERLERFFTRVDRHYQVSRKLRDLCVFARQDVTKDPPFSRVDVISCCNLLIYFEPRLQERVLAIFHYALNPGGFLLLGPSESAAAAPALFEALDKRHKI